MTQWTHTISRQEANPALPTWRTAMSSTNTVYAIGETPSSVLPGRLVWPSAGANNVLESAGSDNEAVFMVRGYGGSVYVPELGSYGTMLIGGTGEHCLTEQINSFGMSEANPSWNFFQQPLYATSLAEANTFNADAYYNATDYAACVAANRFITYAGPDVVTWDRSTFPVGFGGAWVLRRKYGANSGSTLLGNNRPHWFRYSMPCYIPPSMTGTGAGAVVVNNHGTIYGPSNSGPIPPGETIGNYFSEVWDSTHQKLWLHAMNVQTKAWTRLPNPVPQATPAQFSVAHVQSGVDIGRKFIYYTSTGGTWAIYHADLTAGLAGATVSAVSNLTIISGDTQTGYNSIFCVPTSGANAGKRLWYFQGDDNTLVLIDVDALTIRKLAVSLPSGAWRFGWDAANNTVYVTTAPAGGVISCARFVIPTAYTTAGSYSVETLTISMGAVGTMDGGYTPSDFGQRSMFHAALGVILVPQLGNKMLAFRPG